MGIGRQPIVAANTFTGKMNNDRCFIFGRAETAAALRLHRLLTLAALSLACATSAYAYRPFDGTDASVAEPGVFELEAGVGSSHEGAGRSLSFPALVANFGFANDVEFVIEARLDRHSSDEAPQYRNSLADMALSVKHVWRRGTLQGDSGASVASECGVLLPDQDAQPGTGWTCAGIVSNRWDSFVLHLNGGMTRTRTHSTTRSLGLIAEGADSSALRPVAELLGERDTRGDWSRSVLMGMIWRRSAALSFDVGARFGSSSAGRIKELRAGLTWSVDP